jgi:hypothetical protein
VNDVVNPYLAGYMLNHRPKSVLFANGRLAHIKKALGGVVLSDLTDERIKGYIRQRQAEKVSGRRLGNWKNGKTWAARFPMQSRRPS